jgi:hypothetical protein
MVMDDVMMMNDDGEQRTPLAISNFPTHIAVHTCARGQVLHLKIVKALQQDDESILHNECRAAVFLVAQTYGQEYRVKIAANHGHQARRSTVRAVVVAAEDAEDDVRVSDVEDIVAPVAFREAHIAA